MHFGSSVVSITVSTGAVSVTRLAPASRSRAISSVGLMSRPSFLCHVWKSATAAAFLPVYDNLERALKQPTADEAYAKGVEMTMNQLKTVLEKLGITEIEALGQPFDPTLHNAVMHIEDENFGENTVAEVFQAGFRLGDKGVRFAMVKVAN